MINHGDTDAIDDPDDRGITELFPIVTNRTRLLSFTIFVGILVVRA